LLKQNAISTEQQGPSIQVARSANFEILQVLLQEFKKIFKKNHNFSIPSRELTYPREKENHLQTCQFFGGYVSSLEGSLYPMMRCPDSLEASNAPPKNVAANRNDEVAGTGQKWQLLGNKALTKSLKISEKTI